LNDDFKEKVGHETHTDNTEEKEMTNLRMIAY